ncbi:MAG: glycosyltransferase family 2 protein [Rhodobacteraceae bacterium]|nr:glycosyltransferase family 2 protein [Paracoccaceae bacterium]
MTEQGSQAPMITVVILTLNEEKHIRRAIGSVRGFATDVLVVDSGSTDKTRDIARALGAKVLEHPFKNYSSQFNWALGQVSAQADWVMRLDADEIVSAELSGEIEAKLGGFSADIAGVHVSRFIAFRGRRIKYGGLFPVQVIRLFRNGRGHCEDRWMDEHIIIDGQAAAVSGALLDDNLNSVTWWTDKHNSYASREAVDLLNLEYHFAEQETVAELKGGGQAGLKRWIKEHIYARLPGGLRAGLYFIYRFIFRLGFLDGREGRSFHFLQGFWYRYLVDVKVSEVRAVMKAGDVDIREAIRQVTGISLDDATQHDKEARRDQTI